MERAFVPCSPVRRNQLTEHNTANERQQPSGQPALGWRVVLRLPRLRPHRSGSAGCVGWVVATEMTARPCRVLSGPRTAAAARETPCRTGASARVGRSACRADTGRGGCTACRRPPAPAVGRRRPDARTEPHRKRRPAAGRFPRQRGSRRAGWRRLAAPGGGEAAAGGSGAMDRFGSIRAISGLVAKIDHPRDPEQDVRAAPSYYAIVLRKNAKLSASLKARCALSVAPAWPPSSGSWK